MRYSLDIDVHGIGYDDYDGYDILIGGYKVAHKPYDGSSHDEVIQEFVQALGAVVMKQTRWGLDYWGNEL